MGRGRRPKTHLHCHADMRPMQEDVSVPPGGEPGGLITSGGAKGADSLVQRHHPVDEGPQQPGLAVPCHQDLVQGLSTQNIPLHQTAQVMGVEEGGGPGGGG